MAKASDWRGGAILSIVSMVWLCGVPAWAKYGGGSGTTSDPYLIETAEHLDALGADPNDWDKSFKLVADLDLSAYQGNAFHLIGSRWGLDGTRPFSGVFDGDGHTITGFSYSTQEAYPVGLFVYVGHDPVKGGKAEVKNLHLAAPRINAPNTMRVGALVGTCMGYLTDCSALDVTISGYDYAGGLTGEHDYGTILNCACTGEVVSSNVTGGLTGRAGRGTITACRFDGRVEGRIAGGLVGWNEGEITSCGTTGTVTASSTVGGLVGYDSKGSITTSWSAASVKETGDKRAGEGAGGLIGCDYGGTIKSCWASGTVEGKRYVGGFVGMAGGTVSHCYATGAVAGDAYVGGFAGQCGDAILWSYSTGVVSGLTEVGGFAGVGCPYLCYWDIETSGFTQPGAGRGRTTAQMMSAATFTGWGRESQWVLQDGISYPRLVWEETSGQLLVDPPRTYGGGTGASDDPYLIGTAEELSLIACYPDDLCKHFRLAKDIDLQNTPPNEFVSLGASTIPFAGSFDGSGHTIHNLRGLCLFGTIRGSVRDLHLSDVLISGGQTGALGASNDGEIRGCSVSGVVTGTQKVGGLVGYNDGMVEACHADVRVSGASSVGGLVGYNDKDISNSYATGPVTGETEIGGLVGTAGHAGFWMACPAPPAYFVPSLSSSRITACYSLGPVTGQQSLGGLVGKNAGTIVACYAAGPVQVAPFQPMTGVTGNTGIGGLVGKNEYGITYLSYWDIEVSGVRQSAGGRGRTTAQMTTAETFRGWNTFSPWVIQESESYPYFARTEPSGDPITDDPGRYGAGDGTAATPYQLWTAAHLVNLGHYPGDWDKHFVLMDDVDLARTDPNLLWPIGILSAPFTGTFDGNGHIIAHFSCHADSELYVGLFGCIGRDGSEPTPRTGEVRGLAMRNVDVSGYCYVGGLAGQNEGVVSSCSVIGQVRASGKNAGGLLGANAGTMRDCWSNCTVTADEMAGALVGYNSGTVEFSSSFGRVKTTGSRDSYAGGLIGENSGTIKRSAFQGDVIGGQVMEPASDTNDSGGRRGGYMVGGLVALNEGTIARCTARAAVSGSYLVGGLAGYNEDSGTISRSCAAGTVTGGNTAGGLVGDNVGRILHCCAAGRVRGDNRVGGLVGDNREAREVKCCYSTCRVTGRSFVGGLLGTSATRDKTNVVFCLWDIDSSGTSDGVADMNPDPDGVLGLHVSALQTASTFPAGGWDLSPAAGDNSEPIRWIREGQSYPRLHWESEGNDRSIAPNLPTGPRDQVNSAPAPPMNHAWRENNAISDPVRGVLWR